MRSPREPADANSNKEYNKTIPQKSIYIDLKPNVNSSNKNHHIIITLKIQATSTVVDSRREALGPHSF